MQGAFTFLKIKLEKFNNAGMDALGFESPLWGCSCQGIWGIWNGVTLVGLGPEALADTQFWNLTEGKWGMNAEADRFTPVCQLSKSSCPMCEYDNEE